MRKQDWAFFVAIGAVIGMLVSAVSGRLAGAAICAGIALAAGVAAHFWSRRSPGPMPHLIRWVLFVPRGPHSPKHLLRVLAPRSGERILEIGPGVGVHAIPVAAALLPEGVLEVLDIQQEMLDDLRRRAAKSGLENLVARQGDAQKLPHPDHTFDAAYLICVLGEVPDEDACLRELRRVLAPGGRLVVGEVFLDPDFISLAKLKEHAGRAGFELERTEGPGFAYLAVFRAAQQQGGPGDPGGRLRTA